VLAARRALRRAQLLGRRRLSARGEGA